MNHIRKLVMKQMGKKKLIYEIDRFKFAYKQKPVQHSKIFFEQKIGDQIHNI